MKVASERVIERFVWPSGIPFLGDSAMRLTIMVLKTVVYFVA